MEGISATFLLAVVLLLAFLDDKNAFLGLLDSTIISVLSELPFLLVGRKDDTKVFLYFHAEEQITLAFIDVNGFRVNRRGNLTARNVTKTALPLPDKTVGHMSISIPKGTFSLLLASAVYLQENYSTGVLCPKVIAARLVIMSKGVEKHALIYGKATVSVSKKHKALSRVRERNCIVFIATSVLVKAKKANFSEVQAPPVAVTGLNEEKGVPFMSSAIIATMTASNPRADASHIIGITTKDAFSEKISPSFRRVNSKEVPGFTLIVFISHI